MHRHSGLETIYKVGKYSSSEKQSLTFKELKSKVLNLLNYKGIFCMERRYQKDEYKDVRIKNYNRNTLFGVKENAEREVAA